MRFFNDVYDLGSDIDEMVLTLLNLLVGVHFLAFIVLVLIVMRNMFKSEQTAFTEKVMQLEKSVLESKKRK
jgi:hypothetical protein